LFNPRSHGSGHGGSRTSTALNSVIDRRHFVTGERQRRMIVNLRDAVNYFRTAIHRS